MFLLILGCLSTVWPQVVQADCPKIITRQEWDGVKPKHVMYLDLPLELVIVQHTVTQTCSDDQSCVEIVRDIQKTHMNSSYLWDIGPSFLIANTGKIYEGRGWFHTAVHTYGYNNHSIGIAFIGSFQNQQPTNEALDAARALIQCGEDKKYLSKVQVVLHNQLLPTESPGRNVISKVMSWPNWKQDVTEIKKQVDIQDVPYTLNKPEQNEDIESRTHADLTTLGKSISTKETLILVTTKDVDTLSEDRGIIAELIDNLRDLAQQTLKTIKAIRDGIKREIASFLEKITTGFRVCCLNPVNTAVRTVSLSPYHKHCVSQAMENVNILYNNTETKINTCVDKRVDEVEKIMKYLDKQSENILYFSRTTVEETRNCTEVNLGIKSITKACLNSVTRQVQSKTKTFESERTTALNLIRSSVEGLPAAFDTCTQQPLYDGSFKAMTIVSQIASCKPKLFDF